jgi:hypothetical protein
MGAPEFNLLRAIVRRALRLGAYQENEAALAASGVRDWQACLRLAEFHGVLPLVGDFLSGRRVGMSEALRKSLDEALRLQTRKTLVLTAELLQIKSLLAHRGISLLALKGPALSKILYDAPDLRCPNDLDILVHPQDRNATIECLRNEGYEPMSVTDWYCEAPLRRGSNGPIVDVHWSLSPRFFPARFSPGYGALSLQIDLCGETVSVLSPPMHLLYLGLHAARHGWESLDQIAGIAGLAERLSPSDFESLFANARSAGGLRMLCIGLSIAGRILGTPVHPFAEEVSRAAGGEAWVTSISASLESGTYLVPSSSRTLTLMHCALSDHWHRALMYALAVIFLPTESDALPARLTGISKWFVIPRRCLRLAWRYSFGSRPRVEMEPPLSTAFD